MSPATCPPCLRYVQSRRRYGTRRYDALRMTLFLGLLFGSIGTVYMIYGKRQSSPIHLIVGAILIVYPYLFSNAILVFLAGVILTAIPYAHYRGLI